MTSGAIQKGVPTNVFLLIWVSVSWPATPKSASFTSPCSDNNTLAAENKRDSNMIYLGALNTPLESIQIINEHIQHLGMVQAMLCLNQFSNVMVAVIVPSFWQQPCVRN